MVIALLGLGNVGKAVYHILQDSSIQIFKKNQVKIKYILVKNKQKHQDVTSSILTTDYHQIVKDKEVDVIIEMLGASVSYEYIKQALEARHHVITANKEVIAQSYEELQTIALKQNVKLFFEASVGGGIPIVSTLLNASKTNHIYQIRGILNGTTNYILTSMHKKHMDLKIAIQQAQSLGLAEADPTADLEGIDMVRKIAILSMICFNTKIDLTKIYHYGIKNVTREIVEIIDLLGYRLKFIAYSTLKDKKINIGVEPVMLKADALLSNVDYENNYIEYEGDFCALQTMSGKGAGPVTANAILFDLILLLTNQEQSFLPQENLSIIGHASSPAKYFVKPNQCLPLDYVEKNFNEFIITKNLTPNEFDALLPQIDFYARIIE